MLSHHPHEVLLAQFSLYVHKSGLKPDIFQFISSTWKTRGIGPMLLCIWECLVFSGYCLPPRAWWLAYKRWPSLGPVLFQHLLSIVLLVWYRAGKKQFVSLKLECQSGGRTAITNFPAIVSDTLSAIAPAHRKHKIYSQCCYSVGPPSTTLAQHYSSIRKMSCIFWVLFITTCLMVGVLTLVQYWRLWPSFGPVLFQHLVYVVLLV